MSTVEAGATTITRTPNWRAAIARVQVPILFAVSPLAQMRSAPTTSHCTCPLREQVRAGAVGDHARGNAVLAQFPGRQPRALQPRPGLGVEDARDACRSATPARITPSAVP